MKKAILAAIFSLSVVASVHAVTYTDNNPANVWLNGLNPSYTGQFTLAGYNPVAETITSAAAEFTFWDALGNESFSINMGGDLLTHGSFSGVLVLPTDVVNAWLTLDSTGTLAYTVSLTSGFLTEFWLTNASLTAVATARNVPDVGATVVLLGLGIIGILAAWRRFGSA
jgi:hypothetical protein